MKNKEKELIDSGVILTRTGLGSAIFILEKDKDADYVTGISNLKPIDWTVKQMRAMADFMEANLDITLYDDGSGERIKLK